MSLRWIGLAIAQILNPIENLWAKMKELVAEKQPSGGKALIETNKKVRVKEISATIVIHS